jgi:hypothetical protein
MTDRMLYLIVSLSMSYLLAAPGFVVAQDPPAIPQQETQSGVQKTEAPKGDTSDKVPQRVDASGTKQRVPDKKTDALRTAGSTDDIAKQIPQTLDAAILAARALGRDAPVAWSRQDQDPFAAKQRILRAQLDSAKSRQAEDAAISRYLSALNEVLAEISKASPSLNTSKPQDHVSPNPSGVNPPQTSLVARSALLLTGLALLVSGLTIWAGRSVARREVQKALVDAGLI